MTERAEQLVLWAVAVLGVIGFALSFAKVADAVEPSFGYGAPLVPVGIDVGIAAFTGLDLIMAARNMRTRWLRLFPWLLIAATVYLNVSGERDLVGQVAHGVIPMLWVVLVEAVAHWVRTEAGLAGRGSERMDRIRAARWPLAPVSTLRVLRLMVLWEERSYTRALDRWKARRRSKALMAHEHGWIVWRWKAPIEQRLDYRFSMLELPTSGPTPEAAPDSELEAPRTPILAPAPPVASSNGDGDLIEAAAEVAAELRAEGRQVSGRQLGRRLRRRGHKVANGKVAELVEAVS